MAQILLDRATRPRGQSAEASRPATAAPRSAFTVLREDLFFPCLRTASMAAVLVSSSPLP